jgi:hypothetical protein
MSTYTSKRAAILARAESFESLCLKDCEKETAAMRKGDWSANGIRLTADKMSAMENQVIFAAAQKTLRQMNFSVRAVQKGARIAVEASGFKNTKMLMLIENNGAKGIEIKTDWAGLSEEKSCTQMQKALEEGMQKNGVDITGGTEAAERHLDPRGGQLIRSAGTMHCGNLAEGLIRYEETKRNRRRAAGKVRA